MWYKELLFSFFIFLRLNWINQIGKGNKISELVLISLLPLIGYKWVHRNVLAVARQQQYLRHSELPSHFEAENGYRKILFSHWAPLLGSKREGATVNETFPFHFLTCFSFCCAEEQAASLALLWCGSCAAAPTLPVTCWLSSLTSSGGITFSNVLWSCGAILLLSSAFGYRRGWYCSQKWAWSIRIPEDGWVLYEITIYFLLFDPSPQKSPLTAVRGFSPRWNLVLCSCLFHMFYFYQPSKAIYIQLFSSE